MTARATLHDCFGSIIRTRRKGVYEFLCDECGDPYMFLDRHGVSVEKKHGGSHQSKKVRKVASLKALETIIRMIREEL